MRRMNFPGEALQARREELGLSLKQVHEQIRVPLQYIEALERGDVSALPVATYTFGFITSYCECLGVYPEPYLDRYRTIREAASEEAIAAPAPVLPKAINFALPALPAHRPAWMSDVITWGTICGIVLLGWITYSVVLKPAPQEDTRVNAGTIEIEVPEYHFLEDDLAVEPAPKAQTRR